MKVISDAVFPNDDLHFTRLAMFSQDTLAAPKRGKKKTVCAAEFFSTNLSVWKREAYEDQWRKVKGGVDCKRDVPLSGPVARARRAERHTRKNECFRVVSALRSAD